MPKSNVIPIPEAVLPVAVPSTERNLILTARMLGDLFYNCASEALDRLRQAEEQGLTRIAEYTPQDRLLNLKEAAAYLGFKPRTLRSWCSGSHSILQHSLIGGELRFRKAWLDAAVERRSVGPKKIKL